MEERNPFGSAPGEKENRTKSDQKRTCFLGFTLSLVKSTRLLSWKKKYPSKGKLWSCMNIWMNKWTKQWWRQNCYLNLLDDWYTLSPRSELWYSFVPVDKNVSVSVSLFSKPFLNAHNASNTNKCFRFHIFTSYQHLRFKKKRLGVGIKSKNM